MSKRIETSIIINKPLDTVWQEVKVMEKPRKLDGRCGKKLIFSQK